MEWTPVNVEPGEDGKLRVKVDNGSGVPRGIDEAKLIVVDHPPGVTVAPDVLGGVRSFSAPVAPDAATDSVSGDIMDLVSAKDGVFWRSSGKLDLSAGTPLHDETRALVPQAEGGPESQAHRLRVEFGLALRVRPRGPCPGRRQVADLLIRSGNTASCMSG